MVLLNDPVGFEDHTSQPMDETDRALRYYVSTLSEDQLKAYSPDWSDEKVKLWNNNFKNDGTLMLVCCERDVEVVEFRQVLEEYLQYQNLI